MQNSTVEHLAGTISIGVIVGGVLGSIAILICSVSMAYLKRLKSIRSWLNGSRLHQRLRVRTNEYGSIHHHHMLEIFIGGA
jgi:hypothetical protein